jgi:hypothetical protein
MTKLWNVESKKLLAVRSLVVSLGWLRTFGSWCPNFGTKVLSAKSQMLSAIGGIAKNWSSTYGQELKKKN